MPGLGIYESGGVGRMLPGGYVAEADTATVESNSEKSRRWRMAPTGGAATSASAGESARLSARERARGLNCRAKLGCGLGRNAIWAGARRARAGGAGPRAASARKGGGEESGLGLRAAC